MRDKVTTVYTFDELSDRAKESARQWFREGMQTPDDWGADTVLDDVARMGAILGIEIRTRPVKLMGGGTRNEPNVYYCVGDRDHGFSFAGHYYYAKGSVANIKKEAPADWTNSDGTKGHSDSNATLHDIAVRLADVQRRNFYKVSASTSHANRNFGGFGMDIDVESDGPVALSDDDRQAVNDALVDFANWAEKQLEREWEYRNSDEAVDDDIRANEYEFTEKGERA